MSNYQEALDYQKACWNIKLNSQPQFRPTQLERSFSVLQELIDTQKKEHELLELKNELIDEYHLYFVSTNITGYDIISEIRQNIFEITNKIDRLESEERENE